MTFSTDASAAAWTPEVRTRMERARAVHESVKIMRAEVGDRSWRRNVALATMLDSVKIQARWSGVIL